MKLKKGEIVKLTTLAEAGYQNHTFKEKFRHPSCADSGFMQIMNNTQITYKLTLPSWL